MFRNIRIDEASRHPLKVDILDRDVAFQGWSILSIDAYIVPSRSYFLRIVVLDDVILSRAGLRDLLCLAEDDNRDLGCHVPRA